MKRRWAAVLVALAVVAVVLAPAPRETEAAWVDVEAAAATFTATKVPAPESTAQCVTTPGLLGLTPSVAVYWRAPASATGYTLANAEFGYSTGGLLLPLTSALLGNVSTSGTTTYTTTASGGLLGGLLGGTSTVAIRFVGPGGWRSEWLVATASMGLAGINPDCKVSFVPSV